MNDDEEVCLQRIIDIHPLHILLLYPIHSSKHPCHISFLVRALLYRLQMFLRYHMESGAANKEIELEHDGSCEMVVCRRARIATLFTYVLFFFTPILLLVNIDDIADLTSNRIRNNLLFTYYSAPDNACRATILYYLYDYCRPQKKIYIYIPTSVPQPPANNNDFHFQYFGSHTQRLKCLSGVCSVVSHDSETVYTHSSPLAVQSVLDTN